MCQIKWLGQDLNSNLFTLDHVFLALMSVCVDVCVYLLHGKKVYEFK